MLEPVRTQERPWGWPIVVASLAAAVQGLVIAAVLHRPESMLESFVVTWGAFGLASGGEAVVSSRATEESTITAFSFAGLLVFFGLLAYSLGTGSEPGRSWIW